MKVGWACETDSIHLKKFVPLQNKVISALKKAVDTRYPSEFDFDLSLDFVPIVMSALLLDQYSARFSISRKHRSIGCGPQLQAGVFLFGTEVDQIKEIFRGVRFIYDQMHRWGLKSDAIDQFKVIIDQVELELIEKAERRTL